ncbi:MAG TPA: class E sortase [Mycobacteriales bacterium]|jgi:sortase A|nr:class E sortase [Mycobacteriales bacterium]
MSSRIIRISGEALITIGLIVMLFAGYEIYGKTWEINAAQGKLTNALDKKWNSALPDDPIPGQGIARLHIPVLGKDWVVVEGTTLKDIRHAPGHYTGSAMPGELGNFSVAGHRTPAIFWDLDKLSNGDSIIVETKKNWYVYKVYSTQIVSPKQVGVVDPNPDHPGLAPTRKLLTLTTCNPKWDNYQRMIIHAELTGSTLKSRGSPPELGT